MDTVGQVSQRPVYFFNESEQKLLFAPSLFTAKSGENKHLQSNNKMETQLIHRKVLLLSLVWAETFNRFTLLATTYQSQTVCVQHALQWLLFSQLIILPPVLAPSTGPTRKSSRMFFCCFLKKNQTAKVNLFSDWSDLMGQ